MSLEFGIGKTGMVDNTEAQVPLAQVSLFDRCVVRKSKKGRYEIKCRLGLWGVEGPDRESVEDEAMHYWQQYFGDGEYQKHLSNEKVSDAPH
jgi:phage-related baseplate assembly protein